MSASLGVRAGLGRAAPLLGWSLLALSGCLKPCTCTTPSAQHGEGAAPSASTALAYVPPEYTRGHFTVSMQAGHAWFLAPDGQRFLSQGVNAIGSAGYRAPNQNFYDPVRKQFGGNEPAWVKSAFERLGAWGFNTVGAWSDDALYGQHYPYTFMLYAAGYDHPLDHVFDPDFAALVAQNSERARAHADDPYLIGYFLDNELPWWGEFGWHAAGQKSLLEKYARAAAGSGGKREVRDFLAQRYARDIEHFNRTYGTSLGSFDALLSPLDLSASNRAARGDADAFAGLVAERFLAVTTQAVHARDPNHLILCVRFATEAPLPVVQAAGKYCDVVSVNQYQQSGNIDRTLLDNVYAATHKPVLLSEYSFSATENQSGDPNTKGAMVTVKTQQERAAHTTRFASQLLALPYLVGMHWFEWSDESPEGRFDGEDQNYGLVDIQDRSYELVTHAHQALNSTAIAAHERSQMALPSALSGQREASLHSVGPALNDPVSYFEAGQHPTIAPWGDAANGGSAKVTSTPDTMLVEYATGTGWGAGISVSPAAWPFDASGAEHLQVTLQAPVGCSVQVLFNEAGVAAPGQASYEGRAGSDGESYEFPAFNGSGKQQTYGIDLHELERRSSWGNQQGNQQLDLQALSSVDLYFAGKRGSGEIRLISLRFSH